MTSYSRSALLTSLQDVITDAEQEAVLNENDFYRRAYSTKAHHLALYHDLLEKPERLLRKEALRLLPVTDAAAVHLRHLITQGRLWAAPKSQPYTEVATRVAAFGDTALTSLVGRLATFQRIWLEPIVRRRSHVCDEQRWLRGLE